MDNKGSDLPREPPQYTASDITFGKDNKTLRCSWLFSLLFYSGAVSAALIVLAIVGSLHVNKIEQLCDKVNSDANTTVGQWKDYTNLLKVAQVQTAESSDTQSLYLNVEANKQMVKDTNGSITVLDFNKGVTGYYDKDTDTCYLSGGLDPNLATPGEIDQYVSSGDAELTPTSDKPTENQYVSGEDVKDKNWLPTELQGVCAGKKTYWLNKNETLQEASTDSVGAAYHCHYHRICYRYRRIICCPLRYIYYIRCYRYFICH